jgi:hypothetical protein
VCAFVCLIKRYKLDSTARNKQFQNPLDSVFPITSEKDITTMQNSTQDCSSLFVLIFIFVDNRRGDKRSWTEL